MFLCFYSLDKKIDTIPPLTLTMLYEADLDDSGGNRKGKPCLFFFRMMPDKTMCLKMNLQLKIRKSNPKMLVLVGNKAKELISKRVINSVTCVYQGGKECLLFRKFGELCFLVTPVLRF